MSASESEVKTKIIIPVLPLFAVTCFIYSIIAVYAPVSPLAFGDVALGIGWFLLLVHFGLKLLERVQ